VFRLYDPLYASLYETLIGRREVFVAAKFALAFAVMLPPALLLGGTLPLLAAAYVADTSELGRAGGRLYALNTLGAAAGSAAGVLWLPEWIGVPGTYAVAIGLALVAAGLAWALGRTPASARVAAATRAERTRAPATLLGVAFASGFGTLALEVLLIQALAQVFDHSIYSYGVVLVVVLLALAAGAWLAAASEGRIAATRLLGGALAVEAALLFALPAATWALRDFGSGGPGRLADGLVAAVALGGAPLLVGALVLPLTFRLAAGIGAASVHAVGPRIGGLLAANTLGGIVGSLAASFVLLDGIGLWRSIAAVGAAYAAAALLVGGDTRERVARGVAVAIAAAVVLSSPASPLRLPVVALLPGDRIVAVDEGASGVVSVIDGSLGRRMKLNNHYTLEGAGRLLAAKQRAGHVPLLLHPAPRRVAFVGSSTGSTAGAAVLHPVEHIDLVEIVPEVHALAARWFAESNHGVHADPRTRVVVEDGRNHLRATRERYDVVVADLFSPWNPGIGALYAREHFAAVREHLAPGGVFAQWLPVYQQSGATFETIAATFLDVFPNAIVFRADLYARTTPRAALIGFRDAPPSVAQVEERVRALAALERDPWVTRPEGFWMLYVGPLAARAGELARVARNSDARPRFDYLGARVTGAARQSFLRREWPAFAESLAAGAGADAPYASRLAAARDGAALVRASALRLDRRELEMQAEIAPLRSRVPPELLNAPDPSVSELWMSR
jgi:spermidine synthase